MICSRPSDLKFLTNPAFNKASFYDQAYPSQKTNSHSYSHRMNAVLLIDFNFLSRFDFQYYIQMKLNKSVKEVSVFLFLLVHLTITILILLKLI